MNKKIKNIIRLLDWMLLCFLVIGTYLIVNNLEKLQLIDKNLLLGLLLIIVSIYFDKLLLIFEYDKMMDEKNE